MQHTWAIIAGTALQVTPCKTGTGAQDASSAAARVTSRTIINILTGPYLSPVLAISAFVVSIVSLVLTYKQARAANVAANAAVDQARATNTQAQEAISNSKTTELALLHEAQQSRREMTPRLIVGIEPARTRFRAYDHDGHPLEGKKTFDRLSGERIYTISATIRGIIINESSRAVAIGGSGLTGGRSPLWDKEIQPPTRFDELGFYLLLSGHALIFEWEAGNTVADWYDYLKAGADFDRKTAPCIPYQQYSARFASDHSGHSLHRTEIKLERPPVYIDNVSEELVIMDIEPGVYVFERDISPKNMEQLRQQMRVSHE